MASLRISKKEYEKRRVTLLDRVDEKIDAICLFNPTYIFYLTNYGFLQTERPIALLLTKSNEATMFLPSLERDRIEEVGYVEDMETYPDYPGEKHPMKYLKELFNALGLEDKTIGVDAKAPPSVMGYDGPDLTELLPQSVIKDQMAELIREMIMVKSEEEIRLIKESAKWARVTHRNLQELTEPGQNETYVANKASMKGSERMIETLGKEYKAYRRSNIGAFTTFRGQIGTHSAIPHSLPRNATIKQGDVLITGASANVGGYISELERTLVVGEPTEKQRRYFHLMKQAQEVAFEIIEPGIACSTVDKRVRQFYRREGLMDFWRHHTGHGLGLGVHEPPFFDQGDETRLKSGMVMSVEPGVYLPDFAGFRHSDTILVTGKGMERLTDYPRELDELTIPAK